MNNSVLFIFAMFPIYSWLVWRFIAAWKSYEVAKRNQEDVQGWSNMSGSGIIYLIGSIVLFEANKTHHIFVTVIGIAMALLGLWEGLWWIKTRRLNKKKTTTTNEVQK